MAAPPSWGVARLGGIGTASRVVSGKGSVSPATLARVKQAIDELGFRPSHAARAAVRLEPVDRGSTSRSSAAPSTPDPAVDRHRIARRRPAHGCGVRRRPGRRPPPGHRRHRVPDGARLRRPDCDDQRAAGGRHRRARRAPEPADGAQPRLCQHSRPVLHGRPCARRAAGRAR